MRPTPILLAALVLAALMLAVPEADAQRLGRAEQTESNVGSYYFYYQPGEATIQVSVAGNVQNPGLYEVPATTDLGRLLALAGGPRVEARDRRDRRTIEVRLFRPGAGSGPIYATTFQDTATNPAAYPELREGDTLAVDVVQAQGFRWQDAFTIAGGLSAVALIIDAVVGAR